jgi:hypothetical protein
MYEKTFVGKNQFHKQNNTSGFKKKTMPIKIYIFDGGILFFFGSH